jgi:hypothetical protein
LLDVVENQEDATGREITHEAVTEGPGIAFPKPNTARDGCHDATRIDTRVKRDEERTLWEVVHQRCAGVKRELCLADATGADQGQQTSIGAQAADYSREVVCAPDEGSAGLRRVGERLRRSAPLIQINIFVDRVTRDKRVEIDTQTIGQIAERAQREWTGNLPSFNLGDAGLRNASASRQLLLGQPPRGAISPHALTEFTGWIVAGRQTHRVNLIAPV